MEEDARGHCAEAAPSPAASSPSLHRKRDAMLQRLAASQDARLRLSAMRREEQAAEASPVESVQHFVQLFHQSRQRVEAALASLRQGTTSAMSEEQKSSLGLNLDSLLVELSEMETLVSEKSYFAPAYEVRASQSAIAKLREDVLVAKSELLPRKKFSFKSKAAARIGSIEKKEEEMAAPMPYTKPPMEVGKESVLPHEGTKHAMKGIGDVHSTVIVRDFDDTDDGEFTLFNMSDCKVHLRGKLTALFIHHLKNCHIYSGPVTGSVFIENVENCIFMLASHQIRIHCTKSTDFYLRLRSRAIIEYSSKVRFAPYAFHYDGIQGDLQSVKLSEETGMWANVDDFGWLKASPSPNWSILPEDQRLPCVESISVNDN